VVAFRNYIVTFGSCGITGNCFKATHTKGNGSKKAAQAKIQKAEWAVALWLNAIIVCWLGSGGSGSGKWASDSSRQYTRMRIRPGGKSSAVAFPRKGALRKQLCIATATAVTATNNQYITIQKHVQHRCVCGEVTCTIIVQPGQYTIYNMNNE
jgi:hypothetical protein